MKADGGTVLTTQALGDHKWDYRTAAWIIRRTWQIFLILEKSMTRVIVRQVGLEDTTREAEVKPHVN